MVKSWSLLLGRVIRIASYAAVGLSLAGVLAWALGRVLTDSTRWSQYLFWMPTVVVVLSAAVLLSLSAGLRWIGVAMAYASRRQASEAWGEGAVGYGDRAPAAAKGPWWREHAFKVWWGAATAATLGAAAYGWAEWSGPGRATDFERSKSLRFVFWNDSEGLMRDWERALLEPGPDVAIMKPGSGRAFGKVLEKMGPEADFVYTHGFAIVTKAKIKRRTHFTLRVTQGLGIDLRRSDYRQRDPDFGSATLMELATSDRLGRDITVCLIDLPSDVSLWRGDVMREARAALDHVTSDVWRHDDALDRWLRIENPEPFGPPDVLIGDLNTPRGAGSIKIVTGELRSAYDAAGNGYSATYPRVLPLWHLDQAYVTKDLRVGWYQVRNPGGGSHAMQVLDVMEK